MRAGNGARVALDGSDTELTPHSTCFLCPLQALLLLRFRQTTGLSPISTAEAPNSSQSLADVNRSMICRIGSSFFNMHCNFFPFQTRRTVRACSVTIGGLKERDMTIPTGFRESFAGCLHRQGSRAENLSACMMGISKCCGDPWVVVRSEVVTAFPLAVPATRTGRSVALFFLSPLSKDQNNKGHNITRRLSLSCPIRWGCF